MRSSSLFKYLNLLVRYNKSLELLRRMLSLDAPALWFNKSKKPTQFLRLFVRTPPLKHCYCIIVIIYVVQNSF
jgi:hypothetical protein